MTTEWWKPVGIMCALIVSVFIGYIVHDSIQYRRNQVNTNLCLTDKGLVKLSVQALAAKPTKEAFTDPKRYETSRKQVIAFVESVVDAAPCTIAVIVPPDPLGG